MHDPVITNGTPDTDPDTGARPGRLLRGPQAAPTRNDLLEPSR